jgi:hypothetical protein
MALAIAALLLAAGVPRPAAAWWRGGFYVPFPPVVVAPPVVPYAYPYGYPYAPPPGYYPPPAMAYVERGQSQPVAAPAPLACHAPGTICAIEQPMAPGQRCYCTTQAGRSYGQVE